MEGLVNNRLRIGFEIKSARLFYEKTGGLKEEGKVLAGGGLAFLFDEIQRDHDEKCEGHYQQKGHSVFSLNDVFMIHT
jgi:hypothetical protein